MTVTAEQLAALAAIDAELAEAIDELQAKRDANRALIRALVPEPGSYEAGNLSIQVATNRRFDEKKALFLIPAERLGEVTVAAPKVDRKRLEVLMPDVYEQAWVNGENRLTVK